MERFRNAHLWLLIPFGVAILGFVPSYWLRFFEAPWRQHLHGLTATAWFVVVIVQPWLATRGRLARHRSLGLVGLMLAGGVITSALGAIPYNLANEAMAEPARYGLSFLDVVLVAGFTVAVLMAMRNVRSVEDHARWMISTVFWSIFPGLFRLSFVPLGLIYGEEIPVPAPVILMAMGVVNLLVISFLMYRDRRAHPAYVAVALATVVYFLPVPIAGMEWWRSVADALFRI